MTGGACARGVCWGAGGGSRWNVIAACTASNLGVVPPVPPHPHFLCTASASLQFTPLELEKVYQYTPMLSASRVCLASAAGRSALISGRSKAAAGAAATARSRASPTVLLTHRSLRTSSSSYHLSRSRGGRLAQAVARRRQQASTLSGDKVAPPAATAGGKAAASSENKAVATWLFGTAGAVAVMVTVGGITRMTKSGLSMTDWKIQGSLPPSSEVYIYRVNRSCCVEREQLPSSGIVS